MKSVEKGIIEIEKIINDFFNHSSESRYLYQLLTYRSNADETFKRFKTGMTFEILNLVKQLNTEEEIEARMFKFAKAYNEFSVTIKNLGGLEKMMTSKESEIVKMALGAMQVIAKIYCLKKILIDYFESKKIMQLDLEMKKL